MTVYQADRYRGLAVLVRSYRDVPYEERGQPCTMAANKKPAAWERCGLFV